MEGIIGHFYILLGISITGDDPYLFHAHVIKVTLILYHSVPVDYDLCQYMINKQR